MLKKRTRASTRRRQSIRQWYAALSTLTPSHTFGGTARGPRELEQPIGPLRQHLKLVLRGLRHYLKNALNELGGHVLMKQVGHAVDEDETSVTPLARKVERRGD